MKGPRDQKRSRDQARLTREMRAIRKKMAAYTDEKMAALAADPNERTRMERVLADCERGIVRSNDSTAKASLSIEVKRLRRALNAQGAGA